MSDGKIIQENGENIMPITHETCVLDDEGNPITETIGDVSLLNTESKNLVGAINEVFGDTIKERVVNILLNNGTEASINESWKNLLNKLEEGSSGSGGLDIICATELPNNGKENQVCIITDNPVNNFMITPNLNDKVTNDNIITIYQCNTENGYEIEGNSFSIQNENLLTYYYFGKVCQGDSRLSSYVYQNNDWVELTKAALVFLEKGTYLNQDLHGGLATGSNTHTYTAGSGILMAGANGYISLFSFANNINFSLYNTLEFTITASINATSHLYICTSTQGVNARTTSFPAYMAVKKTLQSVNMTTTPLTLTVDISDITGDYMLAFRHDSYFNITFTDIKLY